MLIPKKQRLAVYSELFKEGVMVAKKNTRGINHHILTEVPNLHVLELMKSLKSRGYIKENFNWRWYYWTLTDDGVEYLRNYLHLPVDIIPATHKKVNTLPMRFDAPTDGKDQGHERPRFQGERGDRGDRGDSRGFGRGRRPERTERTERTERSNN